MIARPASRAVFAKQGHVHGTYTSIGPFLLGFGQRGHQFASKNRMYFESYERAVSKKCNKRDPVCQVPRDSLSYQENHLP